MRTLILFIKEAKAFFITCGVLLFLTGDGFFTAMIVNSQARTPEQREFVGVTAFIGVILGVLLIAGVVIAFYFLIKWLTEKWEDASAEATMEKISVADPNIALSGEVHRRIQAELLEGKTMDSVLIAQVLLPGGNKSDIETIASCLVHLPASDLAKINSLLYFSKKSPIPVNEEPEPAISRYDIAKRKAQ